MERELILLDTTFRDGAQRIRAEITNIQDSLKAITAISELGVTYFELEGFANSHNGTQQLIQQALGLGLKARIAAFGRTCPDDVENIIKLGIPVGVLVGKTRLQDVKKSLGKDPKVYLQTIKDLIRTLVDASLEVIFDAEHLFQAWLNDDRDYACQILFTALEAGASWIVLCDTNGGTNLKQAEQVINGVSKIIPLNHLGVHFHNDRGRAITLSELAWDLGINHIQGTIGTIGERTGNASIASFLTNLILEKRGVDNILPTQLKKLYFTYHLVCQALNITPNPSEPWVGENAFASEAGMHVDGQIKDPGSYLHADPAVVGNKEIIGLSEKSGASSLVKVAKEIGLTIPKLKARELMAVLKPLIGQGKNLGLAPASLYLWLLARLEKLPPLPKFKKMRVWDEKIGRQAIQSEASLKIVVNSKEKLVNAEGQGQVDALNQALRKALLPDFPFLETVKLIDFQLKIFHLELGTAAKVRIIASFTDDKETWIAMGVNEDFLEASWEALWDAYCYKIVKEKKKNNY